MYYPPQNTGNAVLYRNVETSEKPALFTPFTAFHFIMGIYAFIIINWLLPRTSLMGKFLVWIAIHTAYEIKDIFSVKNSIINSFGDSIAAFSGFVVMASVFSDRKWKFQDVVISGIVVYFILRVIMYEPASFGESEDP